MSFQATEWARSLPLHSLSAKFTLMMIGSYAGTNGACFPSLGTLAEDTMQSVDTVRRRIRELEQLELLVRLARWTSPDGKVAVTEIGGTEKPIGHRQSSDELRLQLAVTGDQVKARIHALGWDKKKSHDQDDSPDDGVANCQGGEDSTATPPAPSQAAATPPVAQPCNPLKRLSNSSEESTPQPPEDGGQPVDLEGWQKFETEWQEPILRQSIARQVWSVLTPDERAFALKATRGYVAWRKGQRKPPPVSNAQTFLKEREAWSGFAKYDPGEPSEQRAAPALIFIVEGSPEWRALGVVAEIAGTKPPQAIFHDEGRGIKLREALSPAQLALEQFSDVPLSDWKIVRAGTHQCGAWRKFLGIDARAITTGFTTKEINGRTVDDWPIKETGLRVPCDWPPRKDGTLSTTGPPSETYMTEADVRDLNKLKAG